MKRSGAALKIDFSREKSMKRGFTALKSYFGRETDTSQQATCNVQGLHSSAC